MTSIHRLFIGLVFFFALILSSRTPSSAAAATTDSSFAAAVTTDSSPFTPSGHVNAPHDNTKTKDDHSQSTEVHAEVFTGAGKTRRLIPETEAGGRFLAKRSRSKAKKKNLFDHHCSIHTFLGQYLYTHGCDDLSFNVDISCNDDDDGKCKYEENSIDDICKRTSYMFDPDLYIDRDKATGRCVLGLPAVPLVTPKGHENDECAKEHPHLSVKVVAPMDNQDVPAKHLDIYFSDNFGENFYNQDNPHKAEHHADAQRRLLKRKAKKEENDELVDEVEGSTSTYPPEQLEGKELLASFHVESQRRLCAPEGTRCWKVKDSEQYCWTDDRKIPQGGSSWILAVDEGDWDKCIDQCGDSVDSLCWTVEDSEQYCWTYDRQKPKGDGKSSWILAPDEDRSKCTLQCKYLVGTLCWTVKDSEQYCWTDEFMKPKGGKRISQSSWILAHGQGDWSKCTSLCDDLVYVNCWEDSFGNLGQIGQCFTSFKTRPQEKRFNLVPIYEPPRTTCGRECQDVRFNHEDGSCWTNPKSDWGQTCYTPYGVHPRRGVYEGWYWRPPGSDWKEQENKQNCNADICQVYEKTSGTIL